MGKRVRNAIDSTFLEFNLFVLKVCVEHQQISKKKILPKKLIVVDYLKFTFTVGESLFLNLAYFRLLGQN